MERVKLNPLVRERDNHKCHFCKRNVHEVCNEVGGGNTLHHIVPKRFGGKDEPENLITICCYCHQKLEILITKMLKGIGFNSSPTSQTSPKGDFSSEKEHNISLKESANTDSQISSNDETSLNNNIMWLRPNFIFPLTSEDKQ